MKNKNKLWTLMLLLLIFACGAPEEAVDNTEDLGQVEQGIASADCRQSANHFYGVNVANISWFNPQCFSNDSTASCAFPHMNGISALQGPMKPFSIALGTGFTTAERSTIANNSSQASVYMTQQLGNNCTNRTGQPPSVFGLAQTGSSGFYMVFNKVTNNQVPSTLNETNYSDFLQLACTASIPLDESYGMQSGQWCTHWVGNLDYAKLSAWAQANGHGATGLLATTTDLLQKAYAIGMGVGIDLGANSSKLNSLSVSRVAIQSGWSGNQKGWVCNYFANSLDDAPILDCH